MASDVRIVFSAVDNATKVIAGTEVALTDLKGTLDSLIKTMASATPENAAYAKRISEINTAFKDGKITAEQAKSGLEDIRTEMAKGEGVAKEAAQGYKLSFTEINSAIQITKQVFGTLEQVYDATVGKTMKYAMTVKTLSQNLNISASETSRLIQVADDYGIESGQLETALQMAVKNGFVPSIENLAKLADEYVSIQDPTERAAILTEKFGRNWSVLTPLLKEGKQGILDNAAAISDALILDQDAIDKAEELRVATDNLTDAWGALTMEVGEETIPTITTLINSILLLTGNASKETEAQMVKNAALQRQKSIYNDMVEAENQATREALRATNAIQGNTTASDANTGAQIAEERSLLKTRDALADVERAQEEAAAAAQRHADASKNVALSMAEITRASTASMALDALTQAMKEGKMSEAAYVLQSENVMRQMGGMSQAEIDAAVQMRLLKIAHDEGTMSAQEYATMIENLMNKLEELDGKTVHSTVVVEVLGGQQIYDLGGGKKGRAAGGPVSANTPYLVGERGPEIFTPNSSGSIINNNQTNQILSGSGGGITIENLNFNVPSGMNGSALLQEFMAAMARAQRANNNSGGAYSRG